MVAMFKIILTYVLMLFAFLVGGHYLRLLLVGKAEEGIAVIKRPPHLPTLMLTLVACIASSLLMYFFLSVDWQRAIAQVAFLLAMIIMNVAFWRFALNRKALKQWLEPSPQNPSETHDH